MTPKKEMILHVSYPLKKPLLLVGMMGCGKSSVGRRLARIYSLPFVDADIEIEKAGGAEISYLFNRCGEAEFRRIEERIMERLLLSGKCILAGGGGSFLSEKTRAVAAENAVSLFLNADAETIVRNTQGRSHRPLLNVENPVAVIKDLLEKRTAIYNMADMKISYKSESMGQLLRLTVQTIDAYAREKQL